MTQRPFCSASCDFPESRLSPAKPAGPTPVFTEQPCFEGCFYSSRLQKDSPRANMTADFGVICQPESARDPGDMSRRMGTPARPLFQNQIRQKPNPDGQECPSYGAYAPPSGLGPRASSRCHLVAVRLALANTIHRRTALFFKAIHHVGSRSDDFGCTSPLGPR